MPSASTASPASPSTKTESSLCVRTIPGWERLATSRETRSLIGRRSSWRPAECSLRVRWGRPSAASVRRSCRQRERPPSMRDRSPAPPGEPKAHDDDDRNAGDKSEYDEQPVAFRRCGNADDVVEAHDQVGDDDRPNRRHQPVAGLDLVLAAVVLSDQLDTDPEQQRAPDQLEPGISEQA